MKWEYRQHLSHCCQNEMSEHILKWFEQWITLILAINVILFPYLSNFLFEKKNNTSFPPALLDLLKRTQHPWCYCDCQARLWMSFGWTGWCQHPASGEMEPQHFSLLQVELGSRQWQQEHLVTKCCIPVSLVSVESCVPALSSSTVVCKTNDDYSRHSDIYQVFASQLTMQNRMIQMRQKGLNAKMNWKWLQSRVFGSRLLFGAQPSLVWRPGMSRSLLLWNISGSCIYNRGPLSLLSELSVVWLTWLAHPFSWGCGEREGIEKGGLSIGEECDKAIQRFIWNIKQWGIAKII